MCDSDGGCFPPPVINNAVANYSPLSRTVTYECLAGYRFAGGKRRVILTCGSDRQWGYDMLDTCIGKHFVKYTSGHCVDFFCLPSQKKCVILSSTQSLDGYPQHHEPQYIPLQCIFARNDTFMLLYISQYRSIIACANRTRTIHCTEK